MREFAPLVKFRGWMGKLASLHFPAMR